MGEPLCISPFSHLPFKPFITYQLTQNSLLCVSRLLGGHAAPNSPSRLSFNTFTKCQGCTLKKDPNHLIGRACRSFSRDFSTSQPTLRSESKQLFPRSIQLEWVGSNLPTFTVCGPLIRLLSLLIKYSRGALQVC